MSASDLDLLRRYAHGEAQDAFRELVERHLDLVYSVALRQVRSPQLAEEVAQSVFADLARRARDLDADTPVVAWLHVVARRTAIDAVRRDARRRAREQTAAELAAMKPTPPAWAAVEPLLDEAVESLPPSDRSAILLRFFENKSLREVGAALGASEDAAQKRVTRAIEQLREFFVRRGIAVTAAGLATDLSAHALQTAPAGLGAAVTASAAGAAGSTLLTQATEKVVMTTLQKTLLGTACALVLGTGLVEATLAVRQRGESVALQRQTDALYAQIRATRQEHDRDARRLDAIRARLSNADTAPHPSADDRALASAMNAWLGRVTQLKRLFAERPEQSIPELALLSDGQWMVMAQDLTLDTEKETRSALAKLRRTAENTMANGLLPALRKYLAEHHDQLPPNSEELAPYFRPAIDPALLARYEMTITGAFGDIPVKQRGSVIVERSPVDLEADRIWNIGPNSFSSDSVVSYAVRTAQKDFANANASATALTANQLRPFLKWSVSDEAVQAELDRKPGR